MVLGVVHSGVPRGLAGSAYNDRRRECAEGVRLLASSICRGSRPCATCSRPTSLCVEEHLPEIIRRRCRHVVTEDARVGLAAEALRAGDTARLGELFAASQDSMRDDYDISLPEIDALVEIARAHGSLASRMTGGGFGGCTVNLVPERAWERFESGVPTEYPARTGRKPAVFRCQAVDGASIEQIS